MLSDSHMHTWYSKDSDASPESMVQAAVAKGLKSICFTDHEDKDYICDGEEYIFDAEKYFHEMRALQEKYRDQIDIRIGVEIGFQPHLGEYYRKFTSDFPFDFVIGSVHMINSMDPYYSNEFFDGISDAEGYGQALEETLTDIRTTDDFDTLGHLDYVVRYGRKREAEYSYRRFAEQIDAILRYLVEHGKGLELNMAGLKYGLPFAHPHPDVLRRYRELGGEIVTLGSDAHRPEHIAYDFPKAGAILEACGFRYYAEFSGRKPTFRKIL